MGVVLWLGEEVLDLGFTVDVTPPLPHTVFSTALGWFRLQSVVTHHQRGFVSQAPRPEAQRAGSAGCRNSGGSGLPSRGHSQMVVLMDPMEDPDDILRAHRSREKSYLFDVAFDFTATQVRGELGLETHVGGGGTNQPTQKTFPHFALQGQFSGDPAHLFFNICSSTPFLELCPFVNSLLARPPTCPSA